jgi:hypothetical protein
MVISWQSQKLNFEWRTTNFFLEEAIEVGYFLIFFNFYCKEQGIHKWM